MKKNGIIRYSLFSMVCVLLCALVFAFSGCVTNSSTEVTTQTDDGYIQSYDPATGVTIRTHKDLQFDEWSGYNLYSVPFGGSGNIHLQVDICDSDELSAQSLYVMRIVFIYYNYKDKKNWGYFDKVIIYSPSAASKENRLVLENFNIPRNDFAIRLLSLKEVAQLKKILQYDDATIRVNFSSFNVDCAVKQKVKDLIFKTIEKYYQMNIEKMNPDESTPPAPQNETNELPLPTQSSEQMPTIEEK